MTGGSGKAAKIDPAQVLARMTPVRTKAAAGLAPIDTRVKELTEQIETLKKESGELKAKGKQADPDMVADVKARLTKAQGDLDPLRREKRLDDQLKQLTELEKRFGPKGDGQQLLTSWRRPSWRAVASLTCRSGWRRRSPRTSSPGAVVGARPRTPCATPP